MKKMLLMNEYDPVFQSLVKYYYISDSVRRQKYQARKIIANTKWGPIMFSAKISDLDSLLNIVNRYASEYAVDVSLVDQPKNARDAIEREQKISAL